MLILIVLLTIKPAYAQYTPPPTCTSLTSNPLTVNSGGTSTLQAVGCTNKYPNPGPPTPFSWPPPDVGTSDPSPFNTTTYHAPVDTCSTTANAHVTVYGPGGSNTYNTSITINTRFTVRGTIYRDAGVNECQSGQVPAANTGSASLYRGGIQIGSTNIVDGSGNYTITGTTTCSAHHLIYTPPTGFLVLKAKIDGGSFSSTNLFGTDYGPFSFPPSHVIDWCVTKVLPWFQTDKGDVRFNNLNNNVPTGSYAATGDGSSENPSVYITSGANLSFGQGNASQKGWNISNEYSYNSKSQGSLGSFSYSFYKSRALQNNQTIKTINNCNSTSCSIFNLTDGVYEVNGDVSITSFNFLANQHIILLINGKTNIKSNISVPSAQCDSNNKCNLFVLASKGDLTIDKTIGYGSVNYSLDGLANTNLDGLYTSESNIILDGDGRLACPNTDRRLNIGGALIANAGNPLANGATGTIQNKRSLCSSDLTYPSFKVMMRTDFITQLTDFYKATSTKWQEVQP